MSHVAVISINTAKPGKEAELEAAMRALIEPTRGDDGFIQYDLHRDLDNPRVFVFIERWTSRATLAAHSQAPHIAAWRARASELLDSKTLHVLEQLD